ncbi:MAG TPA: hypothetical protein PLC17_09885 [Tenuifilaceae bacterium]|jgi:hypothetical protein|nr:hypothetical protein [Tenuifilaceae bacterium]HPX06232.1 hypothetical protein [Tenuifilaceae bacterium]HQB77951.1 hypothetical protein [Tenuifilaceae bacterium]
MSNTYQFSTDQVGFSDSGIHFLRSGYCYKTVPYQSIEHLTIKRAKELNNWLWVLLVGIALLCFVAYDLVTIYSLLSSDSAYVIYIERLLIPLFPFLLGVYSVVISLRVTLVAVGQSRDGKLYIPLRKIMKQGVYNDFVAFVKEKISGISIE